MPRNPERDVRVRAEQRQKILDIAFPIFAEKGIETISMNEIAAACGISYATLYRQFGTKAELVMAIQSQIWENYFKTYYQSADVSKMIAVEEFEFYLDFYLEMYRNHRPILRFNHYFNAYVNAQTITPEQMQGLQDVMNVIAVHFQGISEKAKRDGTLRTDIPEEEMFSATMHLMLAAVTRYSIGLVYHNSSDPERELLLLKELLFSHYRV